MNAGGAKEVRQVCDGPCVAHRPQAAHRDTLHALPTVPAPAAPSRCTQARKRRACDTSLRREYNVMMQSLDATRSLSQRRTLSRLLRLPALAERVRTRPHEPIAVRWPRTR